MTASAMVSESVCQLVTGDGGEPLVLVKFLVEGQESKDGPIVEHVHQFYLDPLDAMRFSIYLNKTSSAGICKEIELERDWKEDLPLRKAWIPPRSQ